MDNLEHTSLIEIANVMCEIVKKTGYKRTTKNKLAAETTFLGVRLVVTEHNQSFSLESPFRWKIRLTYWRQKSATHCPPALYQKVVLPFPYEDDDVRLTAIFPPNYQPEVEVMLPRSYQRDWIMLRMFAAQFAYHNADRLENQS